MEINSSLQELIEILSKVAEQARRDGWLSIEYLALEELPVFIGETELKMAEKLRRFPLFIKGIELLVSDPVSKKLNHYLDESLTGDDDPEEILIAEFLRCVSHCLDGVKTEDRLRQILK